jgi:hypothetical protein
MSDYRNEVIIDGFVGSVKVTDNPNNGTKNYTFSVCTETHFISTGHSFETETCWHRVRYRNVTDDGKHGPDIMDVRKGDFIKCRGSLRYLKYTDTSGTDRLLPIIECDAPFFDYGYKKPR